MSKLLTEEKLAEAFIAANVAQLWSRTSSMITALGAKRKTKLAKTYQSYLVEVLRKYSKTKSFIAKNEPVELLDIYVPSHVCANNSLIVNADVKKMSSVTNRAVVCGTAGIGKSMFMKHLALDAILRGKKLPIFIDLRVINETDDTIISCIYRVMQTMGTNLGDEYLDSALPELDCILLLDGFDEIDLKLRTRASAEINLLSDKLKNGTIIVSSRPDDTFAGWQSFTTFEIQPLDRKQAIKLISKLSFDQNVKKRFIKELKKGMFEAQKSFLSNPLLLSIMLMTFNENADIPNKVSIFYAQAYEALFNRHDATKGSYKRDHHTKLDVSEFDRVFQAFSIQTYDDRTFNFTRSESTEFAKKAKQLTALEYNASDFIDDCLQSVCLLCEDGLQLVFSHRSFQEFFSAKFIKESNPEVQRQLLMKYVRRLRVDNVLPILYEMSPSIVERELLIPAIEDMLNIYGVKSKFGITHFTKYLKTQIKSVHIEGDSIESLHGGNYYWHEYLLDFSRVRVLNEKPKSRISVLFRAFEKHYKSEELLKVKTSEFKFTTPLVKELFKKGAGCLSDSNLGHAQAILKRLKNKHIADQKSLKDILLS